MSTPLPKQPYKPFPNQPYTAEEQKRAAREAGRKLLHITFSDGTDVLVPPGTPVDDFCRRYRCFVARSEEVNP